MFCLRLVTEERISWGTADSDWVRSMSSAFGVKTSQQPIWAEEAGEKKWSLTRLRREMASEICSLERREMIWRRSFQQSMFSRECSSSIHLVKLFISSASLISRSIDTAPRDLQPEILASKSGILSKLEALEAHGCGWVSKSTSPSLSSPADSPSPSLCPRGLEKQPNRPLLLRGDWERTRGGTVEVEGLEVPGESGEGKGNKDGLRSRSVLGLFQEE